MEICLDRAPHPALLYMCAYSPQMIGDIDKDGSGSIDFEEFLDMMTAKMVSAEDDESFSGHVAWLKSAALMREGSLHFVEASYHCACFFLVTYFCVVVL